jgi:periplasmic divalent cation tolerance protein
MDKIHRKKQFLNMLKNEVKIATTTFSTEEKAIEYSKLLVGMKLVACAQIEGPIRSCYWWQQTIQESVEWRVVMKYSDLNEEKIKSQTVDKHEYDSPQWVSWTATSTESYSEWINNQ